MRVTLIAGETVTVMRFNVTRDELGEPTYSHGETESVDNVVVAPGGTEYLDETRPNGVSVAFTLCFPKTYTRSLRGARIEVRGEVYDVVGDPQAYTEANTPTDWNYTVEIGRTDG